MLPVPPIIAAAQAGRTDRVVELLDTGCGSALDVDASGQTALHKAALLGLFNMAQVLIARKPDVVSACDAGHNTPLHLAAWGRQVRVVAQLLEAQAAVSSADLCGNTPLHRAALVAHVGVGELLLHHRADVDAVRLRGSLRRQAPTHAQSSHPTPRRTPPARLARRDRRRSTFVLSRAPMTPRPTTPTLLALRACCSVTARTRRSPTGTARWLENWRTSRATTPS